MNRRAFKAGEREVLTVDEYKDHVYIGSFVMKAEQPEQFKPADTSRFDRLMMEAVKGFIWLCVGAVLALKTYAWMHK